MTKSAGDPEVEGERLLSAVERLVDDCDHLIAKVEALKNYYSSPKDDLEKRRAISAGRIIDSYSTRSAVSGGVSAVPAILPGGGSLVALMGGSLVDMTLMLKHEVEMVLCLTYLYDRDIRDERERWLAYVLAGINTYEATSGRNYFVDIAEAQIDAFSKYTTRQLTKLVATVLGRVALVSASKNLVRALPLVGVVVGAGANKVLTQSVGWCCVEALERLRSAEQAEGDPIVDAKVI